MDYIDTLRLEYPQLSGFLGANGVRVSSIETDTDLFHVARVLFEIDISSRSLDILTIEIAELGKVRRRELRNKNLEILSAKFVSPKHIKAIHRAKRKAGKRYRRNAAKAPTAIRDIVANKAYEDSGTWSRNRRSLGNFGAASEGRSVEISDELRKKYET